MTMVKILFPKDSERVSHKAYRFLTRNSKTLHNLKNKIKTYFPISVCKASVGLRNMIIDTFKLRREIDSVTISIICNLPRQSLPRLAKHQEAISYLFLLVPSEICLTILSAMLATVHLILQVSTLSQKFFSVTRDISYSSFARQRLSCKELPLRGLIFCLLFLYFIYCGTADVYILNYHSSYYNVKLVS